MGLHALKFDADYGAMHPLFHKKGHLRGDGLSVIGNYHCFKAAGPGRLL